MPWHTVTHVAEDVYRIAEPFGIVEPRVGVETVNMHLVVGRERAALIDTGMGIGDVRAEVRRLTSLPCVVLNTHYHWDHVGANRLFDDRAIHADEAELVTREHDLGSTPEMMGSPAARAVLPAGFDPARYRVVPMPATRLLGEGEVIDLGGRALRALHTPGHSPGHVVFLDEAAGILFSGDNAYRGPMFVCFEGCDAAAFARSARRLAGLGGVRLICPGHNDPITTPEWLGEMADGVEAAVSGRAAGELKEGFFTGREVTFGDWSLWLPA
jgi:glyoxylase-like metal-dependent hydrolase (beta-lactamase superfamily II)